MDRGRTGQPSLSGAHSLAGKEAGVTGAVPRCPGAVLQTGHSLVAEKLETAFLDALIRVSFMKKDLELRF